MPTQPHVPLKPLDRFGFFYFPVVIFSAVVTIANQKDRSLILTTHSFLDIDRWSQARMQVVAIIAIVWTIFLLYIVFDGGAKYRDRIGKIAAWNCSVFAIALICSYFKWPTW